MSKKTFLEKLERKDHIKTYRCKENDAVIVIKKEIGDTGEVHILEHEHSNSSVVLGLKDMQNALKKTINQ